MVCIAHLLNSTQSGRHHPPHSEKQTEVHKSQPGSQGNYRQTSGLTESLPHKQRTHSLSSTKDPGTVPCTQSTQEILGRSLIQHSTTLRMEQHFPSLRGVVKTECASAKAQVAAGEAERREWSAVEGSTHPSGFRATQNLAQNVGSQPRRAAGGADRTWSAACRGKPPVTHFRPAFSGLKGPGPSSQQQQNQRARGRRPDSSPRPPATCRLLGRTRQ